MFSVCSPPGGGTPVLAVSSPRSLSNLWFYSLLFQVLRSPWDQVPSQASGPIPFCSRSSAVPGPRSLPKPLVLFPSVPGPPQSLGPGPFPCLWSYSLLFQVLCSPWAQVPSQASGPIPFCSRSSAVPGPRSLPKPLVLFPFCSRSSAVPGPRFLPKPLVLFPSVPGPPQSLGPGPFPSLWSHVPS